MNLHVRLRQIITDNGGEMAHNDLIAALNEEERAYAKTRFVRALDAGNINKRLVKLEQPDASGNPQYDVTYSV